MNAERAGEMIEAGEEAARQKAKYARLLEDRDVRRWYDNVARGSSVTADVYLRRLGLFCTKHGLSPKRLVGMRDKQVRDLVMDFVSKAQRAGRSGSYIKSVLKAIKSWLDFNDREVKLKVKIKGADSTPTLRNERVPTQDELKRIFLAGDERMRVACALLAHAGLRLEVLGNYTGDDGLRLEDLPELQLGKKGVRFARVPAMVVVREELSKAGHRYFTFLSEEGCGYLAEYLNRRLAEGEVLGPNSPVITSKFKGLRSRFVTAIKISDCIRRAMRKAGFPWRPYVLRSYFDTQLMLAENRGLLIRDYRQFWMGHKGDIESKYTTHKHRLPEEVIERMRQSYARAQKFLQTTAVALSRETLRDEFRRQLLLAAGFKSEEVERMSLEEMSDEEFQAKMRERLAVSVLNDGVRQRVVSKDEAERYIEQGWEFAGKLSEEKVVLRLPV